jgi:ferrous iron transport protein B
MAEALSRDARLEREVRPAGAEVRSLTIALLGAPYVGKSTLFNHLAGFSQHSANWPGTGVEIRTGTHGRGDDLLQIVNLPSAYSLGATTPDERVTRDFILHRGPDVLVVVLSAVHLERTLYLVSEALELEIPVVVAVNMMDVAEKTGIRLEPEVLEAALGVPVVTMAAAKGRGVAELLDRVVKVVRGDLPYRPRHPELSPELETVVREVEDLISAGTLSEYPARWLALKLLEGDGDAAARVERGLPPSGRWEKLQELLHANEGAVVSLASARYQWIERMVRAALFKPRHGVVTLTERLDRVATHPLLGALVLLSVLAILFWLVYQIAGPVVELLDRAVSAAGTWLTAAMSGAPAWLTGLIVDGILAGVGTVMSLLPILIVFFLGMGFLQQVGYLSRAAFVADRFMHVMGLHGQSLLPLFLGFGCNVPAVFGARLIDSPRARLLTVLITPLVPCTGRMAVLVFMSGAIFGSAAPLVTWGLVSLSLVLLAVVGVLLGRLVLRSESPAMMMELPLYHMPNWRAVALETWRSVREFIVRAGTVILLVSMLVWLLANQPSAQIEDSYLAQFGRSMAPVGQLMGLDWKMMVSLITSVVAKENALATMAILSGGVEEGTLATVLSQTLTYSSALAYLVVQITFIPCAPTVSAIKQQTKSWGWTAFALLYLLVLSLAAGIATYQVAGLIGWGG